MRRGVVSTAVITAVTAALALSGCNSHSTSGASGAPANPNAPTGADVAWVNKFCGAIVSFTAAAGQPDVNMQDPKQANGGLDAYLARISTAVGSCTTDLQQL